ncbi:hypothetical protein B0H16DRAFT_1468444 [Mycena metata]|uniref:Uncharacterized protein n=1 Tax=Mycena metata TaxID=1033252 RepID=A0AAD7I128_9AGAR|nr:hypothetical protein B0H16DRAFT_1468444 [Mycena metata]
MWSFALISTALVLSKVAFAGAVLVPRAAGDVCEGQVTLSEAFIGEEKNVRVQYATCPKFGSKIKALETRQAPIDVCGNQCNTNCFTRPREAHAKVCPEKSSKSASKSHFSASSWASKSHFRTRVITWGSEKFRPRHIWRGKCTGSTTVGTVLVLWAHVALIQAGLWYRCHCKLSMRFKSDRRKVKNPSEKAKSRTRLVDFCPQKANFRTRKLENFALEKPKFRTDFGVSFPGPASLLLEEDPTPMTALLLQALSSSTARTLELFSPSER